MSKNQNVSSITERADKAANVDATVIALTDSKDHKAAKAEAHKAIDAIYDGYYRKGGVADLMEQAANASAKLSEHVYKLAIRAVTLAGNNLPLAKSYFKLLCKEAETYLKAKHTDKDGKAPTIESLLPPWTSYKSQINSGIEFGCNPADFATQGAFRAAAAKKKASMAPGGAVAGEASVPAAAGKEGGIKGEAKIAFEALRSALLRLTDEGQNAAAPMVQECARKVAALLNTKEGDKATDDAEEQAA